MKCKLEMLIQENERMQRKWKKRKSGKEHERVGKEHES